VDPNAHHGVSVIHPYRGFTKRTEPNQTVYIFGAGASTAEGDMPTNEGLLKAALGSSDLDGSIRENIREFLDETHHGRAFSPTFEEVFTTIDLSLTEAKYFRGWSKSKLDGVRSDLVKAAVHVLASRSTTPALVHDKFVKNLFEDDGVSWKNTSFLSFNYDIMLDGTLIARRELVGDVDYGCYFRSFDVNYKDDRREWEPADSKRQLFLLKLHGSLNWTWCPICSFMVIFPEENVALTAIRNKETCTRCKGKLEPLIIPPAWVKYYTNPDIVNIWEIGWFLLSQAKSVVFIGYSLPDPDIQFRFMMRRALSQSGTKPKVIVISNHKGTNENATYVRYRRFFGKVDWRSTGFEDFAANPEHASS
jgi:hypothetical protein